MQEEHATRVCVQEATYIVRSVEGEEIHWPRSAAERAGTLKNWIDDCGEGAFSTGLPAAGLRLLLAACTRCAPSRRRDRRTGLPGHQYPGQQVTSRSNSFLTGFMCIRWSPPPCVSNK